MKKIFFIFAAFFFLATNAMAAGGKIAFVDTQSVFDKSILGKKYWNSTLPAFRPKVKFCEERRAWQALAGGLLDGPGRRTDTNMSLRTYVNTAIFRSHSVELQSSGSAP